MRDAPVPGDKVVIIATMTYYLVAIVPMVSVERILAYHTYQLEEGGAKSSGGAMLKQAMNYRKDIHEGPTLLRNTCIQYMQAKDYWQHTCIYTVSIL